MKVYINPAIGVGAVRNHICDYCYDYRIDWENLIRRTPKTGKTPSHLQPSMHG